MKKVLFGFDILVVFLRMMLILWNILDTCLCNIYMRKWRRHYTCTINNKFSGTVMISCHVFAFVNSMNIFSQCLKVKKRMCNCFAVSKTWFGAFYMKTVVLCLNYMKLFEMYLGEIAIYNVLYNVTFDCWIFYKISFG